jgi:hypothetical protein
VKQLLVFRGLPHDSQSVLATIYQLALVSIKLVTNTCQCRIWVSQSLARYGKLSITVFTDTQRWGVSGIFYDPEFALLHDCSLAHLLGRA